MTLHIPPDSLTQFLLLPFYRHVSDKPYIATAPNTLTRLSIDGTFRESEIITDDQGRPLTKTEFYKSGARHTYEDLQNPEGIAKKTTYFASGRKFYECSHDLRKGKNCGAFTEYYDLEESPVKAKGTAHPEEFGSLIGAYMLYSIKGHVIEAGTINKFDRLEGDFKKWDAETSLLVKKCTYNEKGIPKGYYMEVLQDGSTVEGIRLGRDLDIHKDKWAQKILKNKDGHVKQITRSTNNVDVSFTTSLNGQGLAPSSLRIEHAKNGMYSYYVFDSDGKLGKFDTYNPIRNIRKERNWNEDGTSDIMMHNGLGSNAIEMHFDTNKTCTKSYDLSTVLGDVYDVPAALYYLCNPTQLWNKNRTEKADMDRLTFDEIIANHGLETFMEPVASKLATPVLK